MSSLDKLPNSFHAAGTSGRLSPKRVSLLIGGAQLVGCLRGQASPSLMWDASTRDNAQSITENAVNEASTRTTTPNWCAVLSC